MQEQAKDRFPYHAVVEVAHRCRIDDMITRDADEETVIDLIRDHVTQVAARHEVEPAVLARVSATMMDPKTLSARWFMQAAEATGDDFTATARRMGYKAMVKATAVDSGGSRVEIGLAKAGSADMPWIVVEHIDCDPRDPDAGESSRADYADYYEAEAAFSATVERHRAPRHLM